MNSLFFYGTLRHVPLLSVVLGRHVEGQAGVFPDHEVMAVRGEIFPMIRSGGSGANGILVEGLSDEDIARLRFYEGGFDYDLEEVTVTVVAREVVTKVFFSEPGFWQPDGPWSLSHWQEKHGEWSVLGAVEEMSYFGQRTRSDVDKMLPMIQARATAKMNARHDNSAYSPGGMTRADVDSVVMRRPYADYFTLEEFDLSFRRYDGQKSEMVRRAVFVATDAVIVLPYDPVLDRVLLIEQFRPGPFAREDATPWQLEPIAGRIDKAETAQATARREAMEEAGLTLNALEDVSQCYASPGCSTEFYHIFLGLADLPDGIDGVSGLDEEAEDIRSFIFSFDALMELVDEGRVVNAPLVLAALWLARHRERLRAAS
ncbi:NUDIX domain-containing protein [Shimia sp.]|uniref:NUDIX domain-containing protein n=1 Tax=Shimia sp. TaxID=1954381 RepID=UPI003299AA86